MFTPRPMAFTWSAADSGSAAAALPETISDRANKMARMFILPDSFLAEQGVQHRLRGVSLARGRGVGAHLGLEVIAEVGLGLVAHFFGRGFAAVLGDARVVLHAEPTDMQLAVASLADVEPAQRQAQRFQRSAAFPA